jgi:heptosyltransferase-1
MAPRVLLIRTSALGDVVHAMPVVVALRRHLPGAQIGWVVEQPFAALLESRGDIDLVIPVRLRSWRKRWAARETRRELGAAVAAMRRFRADVTIDLMGNHKGAVLSALSGARRRVGPRRADRREPSSALWGGEGIATRGPHAVDRSLSLLAGLDLPVEAADFGGGRIFPLVSAATEAPLVLIHPGAGWENKRVPPEALGWVARQIRQRWGLPVLVIAGPGEGGLARQVAIHAGEGCVVREDVGLDAFTALARRSRLVVGGDTGPLHLAHAVGTPVLMAMGPTAPARHGPYDAPGRALALDLPCSACYRRFDEPKACLASLPRARWRAALEEELGPPAH